MPLDQTANHWYSKRENCIPHVEFLDGTWCVACGHVPIDMKFRLTRMAKQALEETSMFKFGGMQGSIPSLPWYAVCSVNEEKNAIQKYAQAVQHEPDRSWNTWQPNPATRNRTRDHLMSAASTVRCSTNWAIAGSIMSIVVNLCSHYSNIRWLKILKHIVVSVNNILHEMFLHYVFVSKADLTLWLQHQMNPAGLEPAIPGSVGRCLIHWATGP